MSCVTACGRKSKPLPGSKKLPPGPGSAGGSLKPAELANADDSKMAPVEIPALASIHMVITWSNDVRCFMMLLHSELDSW